MDKNSAIMKNERKAIFRLFISSEKLRFSDIEKAVGLRSNHLNYHLEKMLEQELIEKSEESYVLSKEAEKMIPFFAHLTGKEQGPLNIIVAAIIDKEKICLLKRNKRPYKGFWGLIGGKMKLDESARQTALREAAEETGLGCGFEKISAVLHERVHDSGYFKHAFVIFLCRLSLKEDKKLRASEEGEIAWFDLDDLPEEMIPSDRMMIEDLLDKDFCFKEITIEDSEGALKNMVVRDGNQP